MSPTTNTDEMVWVADTELPSKEEYSFPSVLILWGLGFGNGAAFLFLLQSLKIL